LTHSRDGALAEILAEAKKLKTYREDGTTYCEKCDNLVVRIQSVLTNVHVEDLTEENTHKLRLIKDLIMTEESFAQSSAELRDPQKWLGFKND